MMRRISAQYVFTSAGKPLRGQLSPPRDDGTIIAVEDTGGELTERCRHGVLQRHPDTRPGQLPLAPRALAHA
ncbi:MAG: hypothetical protein MZV63_47545 [Marinilabiliales bacterium]|nr:hypothetical protein [Marinilabiliales bacterium]